MLKISPEIHVAMSLNLRNIEKKQQGKVWFTTGMRTDSSFLWRLPGHNSLWAIPSCRNRAKCWVWEPGTVAVAIPGRKASRERGGSQTDCLAHSWHIATTKSWPEQDPTWKTADKPGGKFGTIRTAWMLAWKLWKVNFISCSFPWMGNYGWGIMQGKAFQRFQGGEDYGEARALVSWG